MEPEQVISDEAESTDVAEATVPCEFRCGVAGSGKTYSIMEAVKADPSWGLLCATTGIAPA